MRIYRNKNKKQLLCLITLYYVLFIGFFTYNFGIPVAAYYVLDFLLILLLLLCLPQLKRVTKNRDTRLFRHLLLTLVIIGTISAFVQGFHLGLWIWALRNWGRTIVFFFLCILCLNEKVIKRTTDFFVKLYDVNTVIILLQYFVLRSRYTVDSLNGLFGRDTSGVNATVSLLVLCIVLSGYFSKKQSIKRVIITLAEIAIVATLAELRAILVFTVLFIIVYVFINLRLTAKQLARYTLLIIVAIVGMTIAANYLVKLYPQFAGFFNLRRIIADASTEGGYGNHGYIDRLSAIPVINKYFFNSGGIFMKLFGMGIGNAEYSSFEFLQSAFYKQYGKTYSYLNFTSAIMYLEVGIFGLVLYVASYISLLANYVKRLRSLRRTKDKDHLFYENIGFGAALICIIFVIYNNLQRTDVGIVLTLFLTVPLITRKAD